MDKFKSNKNTVLLHLIDEYLQHVENRNDEFLADLYNVVIWEIKSNDCFKSLLKYRYLILDNDDDNMEHLLKKGYATTSRLEYSIENGIYSTKHEFVTFFDGMILSGDTFFQENNFFSKDIISILCYQMNTINQEEAYIALNNILHTFISDMKFA